ncbi:MAG: flavodoxin [Firmicutes bacterium]|nr:flavodoxin [Bacillota bacterium]
MDILFVNGCVRGKEVSRTYKLAERFISVLKETNPGINLTEIDLNELRPEPIYKDTYEKRNELAKQKDFSNPVFDLANQFALADGIVVAAPLWENSFPSILKVYIEQTAVAGIAFKYSDAGSVGLCRAKKMVFITTRGGYMTGEFEPLEMGARYLKTICTLFGIENFQCVAAEGLDIWGNDVEKILEKALKDAECAAREFLPALTCSKGI